MSDNNMTPQRLVYLGTVDLVGGKEGELWALEDDVLKATSADQLRRIATPFAKAKTSRNVGGVYEGNARLEGSKVVSISQALAYRATIRSDEVAALALLERGREAARTAKRLEAKARAEGPANDLLDQFARIVAKAPFGQQELVIQGFASEVRKRALTIRRKGER